MAAEDVSKKDTQETCETGLEREIGGKLLAIYGAGTILGAGIYVLIGKIIGEAGLWTPLAFLLAAAVAAVNGMVYAELTTRTRGAGGPTGYVSKAFDERWFSVVIGWMIVTTGVVSAATITTGFSSYLNSFFEVAPWISKTAVVLGVGLVAALGAKESAWFMAITTTAGVAGLVFVIWLGFTNDGSQSPANLGEYLSSLPPIGNAAILTGVLSAAFLAVYSFIGFEDMVHMAEEVKKPSESIPFAIAVALGVAALMYVAVSLASLMIMTPAELDQAAAPLVEVAKKAGYPGWPLAILSLWIILNGALAQIVMCSRVIYSLRKHDGAPPFLVSVNSNTGTPLRATIAVAAVILLLALFFPTETLASATSFIMLLIFMVSNAALIVLERRDPDAAFDVPKFLPWVGLILSAGLVLGQFFFAGGH